MKYAQLAAFEKHLKDAAPQHLSDIYFIISKESFQRQQALDKLSHLVLKEDGINDLNMKQYDATKADVNEILTDLETLSFFTKKRLLVIHNAEALDKESTSLLEKYFAHPNRSVCLAIAATAINRATTFYKNGEKAGIILDIPDEKPWEKEKSASQWLSMQATEQGKQMSPQVAQILVKQLGTDQALLHNELQKLICYTGERKSISEKDLYDVCTKINQETGWQLGEALFQRDAAAALRIAKGLLDDGTALIALLRQIRYQYQTEYQVCSILHAGGTPADIAQEFPYMKGQILNRHVQQAQAYGMKRFRNGILAIDKTELDAKNSGLDDHLLAERLVIKLTQ